MLEGEKLIAPNKLWTFNTFLEHLYARLQTRLHK